MTERKAITELKENVKTWPVPGEDQQPDGPGRGPGKEEDEDEQEDDLGKIKEPEETRQPVVKEPPERK
jgi:hypothetical protein